VYNVGLMYVVIKCLMFSIDSMTSLKQDAQLLQRDRAAGCVIVFATSRRVELEDNILRTL